MTISKQQKLKDNQEEEKCDYSEIGETSQDYTSEDSDMDPSYSILEETNSKLSNLSITNKSKSRIRENAAGDVVENLEDKMNASRLDEKSFERVQQIIEAGQLEKLKVEQCKVYLRKHGLRLTGSKDTLMERIKEHQVIRENTAVDVVENLEDKMSDSHLDEKSFEIVQQIIEAGQHEKLKVEQCKVYLRKHGLRLTGSRDTLIDRIKEHQEILNGGGEKRYPMSSFLFDCKGDACKGDVVMFEQKVYEMFLIASRSANGPAIGTRIVAGRIVKESYGAAKQQHTFTIEVLWSRGEKPLPPLHPLLIKGRNLYRLKTLRQKWEDEGERQKVITEKHLRGSVARSDREVRVQKKETRQMLKGNRKIQEQKRARIGIQPQQSAALVEHMKKVVALPQQPGLSIESGNLGVQTNFLPTVNLERPQPQKSSYSRNLASGTHPFLSVKPTLPVDCGKWVQPQQEGPHQSFTCIKSPNGSGASDLNLQRENGFLAHYRQPNLPNNGHRSPAKFYKANETGQLSDRNYQRQQLTSVNSYRIMNASPPPFRQDKYSKANGIVRNHHEKLQEMNYQRQPLTSLNSYLPSTPTFRQDKYSYTNGTVMNHHEQPLTRRYTHRPMSPKKQLCRYYGIGRCHFGGNCKFLHEQREA